MFRYFPPEIRMLGWCVRNLLLISFRKDENFEIVESGGVRSENKWILPFLRVCWREESRKSRRPCGDLDIGWMSQTSTRWAPIGGYFGTFRPLKCVVILVVASVPTFSLLFHRSSFQRSLERVLFLVREKLLLEHHSNLNDSGPCRFIFASPARRPQN